MKQYKRTGFIARFKPLHLGGATILQQLCEKAEKVIIGIGSSNRYDVRNPFTAEESKRMIGAFLKNKYSNYEIKFIPDFGQKEEYKDGKRWVEEIINQFGELDGFVTGNGYSADLLKDYYKIINPCDLIPKEKRIVVSGTMIRVEMARNGNYQDFIPKEVVEYLEKNNLVERFRKEFGLMTLSEFASKNYLDRSIETEKKHIMGEN
jgi:nicotinamide-nucleotide adenylyltransferase